MTFLLECRADKSVFQTSLCIAWIHNDSMYVRFGEIRNTKTWSKSNEKLVQDILKKSKR